MVRQKITLSLLLSALLAMCFIGVGCRALGYVFYLFSPPDRAKTVEPEFDGLAGRKVAVLIVADDSLLYEYKFLRLQLSSSVAAELEKHLDKIQVIPPQQVVRYQDDNLDWALIEPAALGRKLGAEFFLQITLLDYGTQEPGSENLYRGRISADVELFQTLHSNRERCVWHGPDISVSYPEDGRPVARIGGGMANIERETQQRFAEALVKKFRRYEIGAGK